jgi:hypothetical protein
MDNSKQLEVLSRFYASEEKPQGVRPVDLSFVVRLILRKADERPLRVADETWARELGCGVSAFRDSVARVEEQYGWVHVVRGQRKGMPSSYTLLFDKLPLSAELKRTIVSDDARKITKQFMGKLKLFSPKRRFYKNTDLRWSYYFQKFLDRLNGDLGRLSAVIDFALAEPAFRGPVVQHGPKAVKKSWKKLTKAFEEHTQKLQAARAEQEMRAQHNAQVDALFAENE